MDNAVQPGVTAELPRLANNGQGVHHRPQLREAGVTGSYSDTPRINVQKAPFPWFGGKSKAAPAVWKLLGDVAHYVEPFFGSGAVLLNRPHPCNRTYYSETVNDLDGLVVNVWRAIQHHPDAVAEWASWPVTEADKMARQLALVRWRETDGYARLAGDPDWCDVRMAGWWLWGVATAIGSTWCAGGPWVTDDEGRAVRRPKSAGVTAELPHLANNGQGINHANLREPGVTAELPRLGDDGQGIHTAAVREPGVRGQLPRLCDDGRGINRPQLREAGVGPDLQLDPGPYHPVTMPQLRLWMGWLSARLRHVRIVNGDWRRVATNGAAKTLPVRQGDGVCGIFLDPPYADTANRTADVYNHDSLTVAHDVREWALSKGDDPDLRIVVAGFDGEHDTDFTDAGWTEHEWYTDGYLTGGMGNTTAKGTQQHRERLWASPHCLTETTITQPELFG